MEPEEVKDTFCKIIQDDEDLSVGVAAIKTLMHIIQRSGTDITTIQGLHECCKNAIATMKNLKYPVAAITSGCELFLRFITFAELDTETFEECKQILLNRGDIFLDKLNQSRPKIVKYASRFIGDGVKILTHSRSRVVLQTFKDAAKSKKFKVYVTISGPDESGLKMVKDLEAAGIPCVPILDSAIGYIMEQIDFVMIGAEAVAASGGIINKIGSYTMAICAKNMNKSFYVLAESFKFTTYYPLNEADIPLEYKYLEREGDLEKLHPLVDYTPPQYITLLFSDLGVLTVSAVSDELLKLYV